MKVPKSITTYCPRCNTHTEHEVSLYKPGKRRKLAAGERHHERVDKHGYGGSKAPIQRQKVKTTKKQTLKLRCKKCGYILTRKGMRLKKIEVVER
ncbi:50S ribosomal protein L44e [Candidatus Bathyarchaeota archaeon ex4484_205]|nr:MAG: 50S ribosomal protein L44e [Candidatus Bathyarchaeota archaeon ex4484_205]RLG69091.1 MAG: 50S ribosomal protein L44e [archaeon]